jgi:hypothetical protein
VPAFFGLTPNDREIYLEHIFLLMYYMGFTYNESYNLPIQYRIWFIRRVGEEINKSNSEESGGNTRAAHHNSPDARAISNKHRSHVPAKLRRFT